jgi:mono/diheme cytochrome c family protein
VSERLRADPRRRLPRVTLPLVVGLLAAVGAFIALGPITESEPERASGPPNQSGISDVAAGAGVFARMGCGSCHRLAAARSDGGIGPNLDQRLPAHTRASLSSAIVAPPSSGGFYVMPSDYGERLSPDELDDLVSFLLDARR